MVNIRKRVEEAGDLFARGLTRKAIAASMGIKYGTASKYLLEYKRISKRQFQTVQTKDDWQEAIDATARNERMIDGRYESMCRVHASLGLPEPDKEKFIASLF